MTSTGAERAPVVDVIPLGGLGEFGMNMMLDRLRRIRLSSSTPASCSRSPSCSAWISSSRTSTSSSRIAGAFVALVLTHGHEDHIGAVAHVLRSVDGPVYGTRFTLALVEPKLDEHGIDAQAG